MKKSYNQRVHNHHLHFFWVAPTLALLIVVCLYPTFSLFYNSFFEFFGTAQTFVGFKNYITIIKDPHVMDSLVRSAIYVGGTTIVSILVGMTLALCLSKSPLRKFLQPLVIIPWAIPTVVSSTCFKWFFNDVYGLANDLLMKLNLIKAPIQWLIIPELAFIILILLDAWTQIPFVTVALLAGIESIPEDYYEAAKVDGAGAWDRFKAITLPLLKNSLLVVFIVVSVFSFRTLSLALVLTGGGPGTSTTVFALYVYQVSFFFMRFGYASALGVLMLFIVIILSIIEVGLFKTEELI